MTNHAKQHITLPHLIYIGAILFLLSWIIFWGRNSFWNTHFVRRDLKRMETEVTKLKTVNDSLRNENERLKTSLDAAEKAAREQFGLIKPGEKVFRFIPPDGK
ncbi:MAG: septum formation initiator family protein [Candidatus Cloacimonetes bacterium]|nr:septum formation initiator family protein [Candidatus Cloacimonadota bacterium]